MRRRPVKPVSSDGYVAVVTDLIERLLADLARLGYGDEVDFGYMATPLAAELRDMYPTGLPEGWSVEADYRDGAEVRGVFPDDSDELALATADVAVDDRSMIRLPSGAALPTDPRRYRLIITVDLSARQITDVRCGEVRR